MTTNQAPFVVVDMLDERKMKVLSYHRKRPRAAAAATKKGGHVYLHSAFLLAKKFRER